MNLLYDLMVFIFVVLFGTSALIWINIGLFIVVSKFVNGNVKVQVDVPYGNKDSTSPEQGKEIIEDDGDILEDTSSSFEDTNSSFVDLEKELPRNDEFKEKFKERIEKLKEEQVVDDGVFSYDEKTEDKIREVLDRLGDEIGDDLPSGVEVITNEYERDLENRR